MKYLIIEDETLAAERLREKIAEQRPNWQCIGVIGNLSQMEKALSNTAAELAFVDIHLGDGLSFLALEKLEISIPLIFTTAYDQYAIRAFKHNSVDYLLKPIHNDDLQSAIKKFESQKESARPEEDWRNLLKSLKPNYKERFLVAQGEKLKTINCSDIAFFHASGKHCFIHDRQGKEYLIDGKLKDVVLQVSPAEFFQINRQFIINLNYISELQHYSKSRVKVIMQPSLPEDGIVSSERSARFKAWLQGEIT